MPDPRQQDHRLNKDGLVSYRYLVPREILINKKAQVFYEDFRLESNLFIFFSFIYQTCNVFYVLFGKQVAFGKDEKLQSWIS